MNQIRVAGTDSSSPAPVAPPSAAPSAAQATKTAATGTVATLPNNSVSIVIDGVQHFQFGSSVYRPVVQGSAIIYLQVR